MYTPREPRQQRPGTAERNADLGAILISIVVGNLFCPMSGTAHMNLVPVFDKAQKNAVDRRYSAVCLFFGGSGGS